MMVWDLCFKVKGRMSSDDYIKLFSDTLLSFTASVGPA